MAEAPSETGDSAPGTGGAPGTSRTPGAGGASGSGGRALGVREALLVGELVVVVVLLAGVATYLLPGDARDVILRTPLLIVVLIVGTAAVLWRISRPGGADR